MVPYTSAVYIEHVFKFLEIDGNEKVSSENLPTHMDKLVEAAFGLRDLVRKMEEAEGLITGYIVYRQESAEELTKQAEEEAKLKELIKANQGDNADQILDGANDDDDNVDGAYNEQTAAIIKKFKGKILKEFLPHFLLKQYEGQDFLEYETFETCCDEYFSQASKQKEVNKIQSKESAIWSKMNKIKEDQEKRISGLQKEQDLSEFKAILLTKYIFEV